MKEFENDLLSGNVEEKYLNMSREELEKIFGSEFLKTVKFGNKIIIVINMNYFNIY